MRMLLLIFALPPLLLSDVALAAPVRTAGSAASRPAKDSAAPRAMKPPASQPSSMPASAPSTTGNKAASGRREEAIHVARFAERVVLDSAMGATLEVKVKLGDGVPPELLLPIARGAKGAGLLVESQGKRLNAELRVVGGDALLAIDTRDCSPRQELRVRYGAGTLFDKKGRKAAPHGVTLETYRFVNTTHTRIDAYSVELILPTGDVVQRIVSTRPPVNPKSPDIPYRMLGGPDGARRRLSMRCRALAIGDECALTYGRQPAERSSMPLILGIVLGLLYLWGFRSVLRSQ